MNFTVKCEISLSKKLRSVIGSKGSVVLQAPELINGKGYGTLSISTENDADFDIMMGETSIILIPKESSEEYPGEGNGVSTIFSAMPQTTSTRTPSDRLAATKVPEKKQVPYAIVTKKEVVVPEEFKVAQQPKIRAFIKNMEELTEELRIASSKFSNIDPESITDARQRALAMEQKEKMEAISPDAWIVNEQAGSLAINDLGISLPLNVPYNLSNISAKRIAQSGELRSLIRSGFVRFCTPDEVPKLRQKAEEDYERMLPPGESVFSHHAEAEAALEEKMYREGYVVAGHGTNRPTFRPSTTIREDSDMEITPEDLLQPTEEQSMILNLTQSRPTTREDVSEMRTSLHGQMPPPLRKRVINTEDKRIIRRVNKE